MGNKGVTPRRARAIHRAGRDRRLRSLAEEWI